jgi:alkaline phosphatase
MKATGRPPAGRPRHRGVLVRMSKLVLGIALGAAVTTGLGSILTTKEGAPMEVSYGTAPKGGSQSHTGAQLRVAAQGPQAANVVGLNDQTELYHTLARAIGVE